MKKRLTSKARTSHLFAVYCVFPVVTVVDTTKPFSSIGKAHHTSPFLPVGSLAAHGRKSPSYTAARHTRSLLASGTGMCCVKKLLRHFPCISIFLWQTFFDTSNGEHMVDAPDGWPMLFGGKSLVTPIKRVKLKKMVTVDENAMCGQKVELR